MASKSRNGDRNKSRKAVGVSPLAGKKIKLLKAKGDDVFRNGQIHKSFVAVKNGMRVETYLENGGDMRSLRIFAIDGYVSLQ